MVDTNPFDTRKTCFVVMPFGDRTDPANAANRVNFEAVYDDFIAPLAESAGLACERCDRIVEAGSIYQKMFEHLLAADAVVVDLSHLNPNVFYELGVRHGLAKRTTILIQQEGTNLPFNLRGQEVVAYPASLDRQSAAAAKIVALLRQGLASTHVDSPIHLALDLRVELNAERLPRFERHCYAVGQGSAATIGMVTGDLRNVRGIDVWVNSENTDMQMARPYEMSISGLIRYHGARRNKAGRVVEDTIAQALAEATEGDPVPATHAIATTSGALEKSHGVRCLVHVAAAQGELGRGYRPVEDLGACVRNALECIDGEDGASLGSPSVLFPLLGTGTARGEVESHGRELLTAAIAYLRDRPQSRVRAVWFLCLVRAHLDGCEKLLKDLLPGAERQVIGT